MRRKLTVAVMLAVTVVALVWLFLPPEARARVAAWKDEVQTITGAWTFAVLQTFAGGVDASTPPAAFSSGAPALSDPASAPTVVTSTVTGACTSANTYRTYFAWMNQGRVTGVSPASGDIVPSPSSRRLAVTRTQSVPPGADGWIVFWSAASDGHVVRKACGVGLLTTFLVAPGTSTYNCVCSAGGTAHPGVNALTSPTYGIRATMEGRLFRPLTRIVEVCKLGCQYTRITDALTDITDASSSRRYQITIGVGDYDELITMKSYVSLVGSGPVATRIRGSSVAVPAVTVPANGTEIGMFDLQINGGHSLEFDPGNTVRTTFYANNCIFGTHQGNTADGLVESIDAVKDNGSLRDIWIAGSIFRSEFDGVYVGWNSRYVGYGNRYEGETDGSYNLAMLRLAGGGSVVVETGSSMVLRDTGNGALAVRGISGSFAGGDFTRGGHLRFDGDVLIETTGSTRSGKTTCFDFPPFTNPNSSPSHVDLSGSTCRINSASSSGTVQGLSIASDADYSNFTFVWDGGRILLQGGATREDVRNDDTATSLTMTSVLSGGNFVGSGSVRADAPLIGGRHRLSPLVNAPATCSIGDTYADTSGAFCACTAANTWSNMTATGSCV